MRVFNYNFNYYTFLKVVKRVLNFKSQLLVHHDYQKFEETVIKKS